MRGKPTDEWLLVGGLEHLDFFFPHINELLDYIIPPTRLLNMDFCFMKEIVSGHSEVMVK